MGRNPVCCLLSADVDPMQTGQLQRDLKKVVSKQQVGGPRGDPVQPTVLSC